MPEVPLVIAALVCERVLEERDGVLSATRIVDRFVVERPAQGTIVPDASIHYVAMLRRGSAPIRSGDHAAEIALRYPSGQREVLTTGPWAVTWPEGNEEDEGVNLNVRLTLGLPEEGVYWLDLLFDGNPVASTPFRVIVSDAD